MTWQHGVVIGLAAVLVGCGVPEESADAGVDAGVVDAGPSFEGTVQLTVFRSPAAGGGTQTTLNGTARFLETPFHAFPRCTVKTVESCRLERCAQMGGDSVPVSHSAGTITATGGTAPVTMDPIAAGGSFLYSAMAPIPPPVGGEAMTIAATGGTVPSFSLTLTGPAPLQALTPAESAQPLSVPRTAPFTVTWAAATGEVRLEVEWTTSTHFNRAECHVSAQAGAGAVPVALLQEPPAGAELTVKPFAVGRASTTAGVWQVRAEVSEPMTWQAGGQPAVWRLQLQ